MIFIPNTKPACLYCGALMTKRNKRGEHIVPAAIGGTLTLNCLGNNQVCSQCNNGCLSELDKELCSRSFLALIASQEMNGVLPQLWDIDHSARNLLIEASAIWRDGIGHSVKAFPQVIFDESGVQFRADCMQIRDYGLETFRAILIRSLKRAVNTPGKIHYERIGYELQERGYRLPPRFFAPVSLDDLAVAANEGKTRSFILRYIRPADRSRALEMVSQLDTFRFNRFESRMSSLTPCISHFFDTGKVVRGMMKIGINLLAAYCERTPVNCESFKSAIQKITGISHITARDLSENGFIEADALEHLQVVADCHSFRIVRVQDSWLIYLSFFGGRLGGCVRIVGPNNEAWNTLDVVVPIKGRNWTVKKSALIVPVRCKVCWSDFSKLAPSAPMRSSETLQFVTRNLRSR